MRFLGCCRFAAAGINAFVSGSRACPFAWLCMIMRVLFTVAAAAEDADSVVGAGRFAAEAYAVDICRGAAADGTAAVMLAVSGRFPVARYVVVIRFNVYVSAYTIYCRGAVAVIGAAVGGSRFAYNAAEVLTEPPVPVVVAVPCAAEIMGFGCPYRISAETDDGRCAVAVIVTDMAFVFGGDFTVCVPAFVPVLIAVVVPDIVEVMLFCRPDSVSAYAVYCCGAIAVVISAVGGFIESVGAVFAGYPVECIVVLIAGFG